MIIKLLSKQINLRVREKSWYFQKLECMFINKEIGQLSLSEGACSTYKIKKLMLLVRSSVWRCNFHYAGTRYLHKNKCMRCRAEKRGFNMVLLVTSSRVRHNCQDRDLFKWWVFFFLFFYRSVKYSGSGYLNIKPYHKIYEVCWVWYDVGFVPTSFELFVRFLNNLSSKFHWSTLLMASCYLFSRSVSTDSIIAKRNEPLEESS